MRLQRFLLLGIGALALAACSDEESFVSEPGAAALIRYINAVPDTLAMDFRVVDNPIENLPTMQGVAFRQSSGGYQRVTPGNRAVRVFLTSSDIDVASTRMVDTTITFEANKRYTILHVGSARANTDRIIVFEDEQPAPAAGNIAIRAYHAAVGVGAVDVYVANSGTADPVAGAVGSVPNLAFAARSPYVTLPTRPAGTGNLYTFAITGNGSATPLLSATPNFPGLAQSNSVSAQGGMQISGSVISVVVFPPAPANAPQASSANAAATIVPFNERQLPWVAPS